MKVRCCMAICWVRATCQCAACTSARSRRRTASPLTTQHRQVRVQDPHVMVALRVRRLQCLVGQIPVIDSFDLNGHRRERLARPGPELEVVCG